MPLSIDYTEQERLKMARHDLVIEDCRKRLKKALRDRKLLRDRARARTIREVEKGQ